jgi:hypothetical protein
MTVGSVGLASAVLIRHREYRTGAGLCDRGYRRAGDHHDLFLQYYSEDVEFSRDTLPAAIFNFAIVSLGSIFAGLAMALACCYICKHTQLREFPKYEISLLFLFAYGAYAFAEVGGLEARLLNAALYLWGCIKTACDKTARGD